MEDLNSHLSSAVPLTMELNKKIFLDLVNIHPEEWEHIHTPYEFFEKQMKVFLQNSFNYMNYMNQLFFIWLYYTNAGEEKFKQLTQESTIYGEK